MMEPVTELTISIVQDFRKALSNVLAAHTCLRHHANFAWLTKDMENYKICIWYGETSNDEDGNKETKQAEEEIFVMPKFAKLKPFDKTKAYKKEELAVMQINNDYFLVTRYWDNEAIKAIKKKFPDLLVALEVYPGLLPANLTA